MTELQIIKLRIWILRFLIRLCGLGNVFPSWSGFGIATDWPLPRYEKQIRLIKSLFEYLLPETYVSCGPCFAAGGAMVIYAWPKDDPRVIKRLAEQSESPV